MTWLLAGRAYAFAPDTLIIKVGVVLFVCNWLSKKVKHPVLSRYNEVSGLTKRN